MRRSASEKSELGNLFVKFIRKYMNVAGATHCGFH